MSIAPELVVASILTIGIALVHSVLGERYILRRLFRMELPKLFGGDFFTKQTLRFAWHLTSVAWVGFAAILISTPSRSTIRIIGIIFLASVFFPLIATRGKHLSWIIFLAIAALCWSYKIKAA